MHATRIVMFVLGGWILGALCVDTVAYMNVRLPDAIMAAAPPEAQKIITTSGAESIELLLHHFAAEGNRLFLDRWESFEILLGVVLTPLVYFAADRRVPPVVLAGIMLILTLFQYFAVAPEMAFRGRETDFPPGRGNVLTEQRVVSLTAVHIATEGATLITGLVLGVYIARYRSRRRRRSTDDVAAENAAMRGL